MDSLSLPVSFVSSRHGKQVTSRKLFAGKTVSRGNLRAITLPSRVTPREFISLVSVFPVINVINEFFPLLFPTVEAVGWERGTLSSQFPDYDSEYTTTVIHVKGCSFGLACLK